ncbi:MAG: type IV pili twitching motility protein PilT [Desulfobacterales bacterium CG23_combo_of_CG06-09_8_20_14_all_51_8]|nr:MAG: type IV pili twitching motility protein PilT [Desulfobacterales bacterium CG23_combo_of_CG06-09_8_20_14_all_51_8]
MAKLDKVFKAAMELNASDVHIVPDEPFIVRHLGVLKKLKSGPLSLSQCKELVFEILTEPQRKNLDEKLQLDFGYELPEIGRFRGSVMQHQRGMSAVFRVIPPKIPTLADLGMPDTVRRVLDNHQGLILVTGATGHGKSTTLAAMVDYINATRSHHILTVEDPIEFIHPLKRGVVNQRQLGTDTLTYGNALRGALREDPDVIMIGELRDLETMSLAITAAETGHLVIGTLSTSSAPKTVERIIDSFPTKEQNQIRTMLSEGLKAVITQRLIPAADKTRMVLALEILIGTLPMTNLIRDAKTFQIPSMMQTGKKDGMLMMDESIMALMQAGKITAKDAAANANRPEKFKPFLDKTR